MPKTSCYYIDYMDIIWTDTRKIGICKCDFKSQCCDTYLYYKMDIAFGCFACLDYILINCAADWYAVPIKW